jgi:ribosome biogenesis GTPase / thiamine phosphate phosphatase
VGDRVDVERDGPDASWTIARIHPRQSQLARRSPTGGYGERVVVANIDQVLVVFAAARPEPHPRMLDRFLVIAEANELAVQIVVNKCDLLPGPDGMRPFADYVRAGYPVHRTSTMTGEGLELLRETVQDRISALSGPSGVGKSSLLNALFPGLDLRVGAISDSVNKGRHTTVGALLHPLPGGGFVADTPGLREVGLWGIDVRDVAYCFPELRPYLDQCRFADCTHLVEPGCAVRDAVEAGTVSRARWESYGKLREELSANASMGW